METQINEKKEQLEFEDIKSELDAIVASSLVPKLQLGNEEYSNSSKIHL